MRYVMIFLALLFFSFFFLLGKTTETFQEKPVFTRVDSLALNHNSFVDIHEIRVKKVNYPNDFQQNRFRNDYSNL